MKSVLKKAVQDVKFTFIEGFMPEGLEALNRDFSAYVDRQNADRLLSIWEENRGFKKEEDSTLFYHFFNEDLEERSPLPESPASNKDIFLSVFLVGFGYAKATEKDIPASFAPIYGEAVKAINASGDGIISPAALKPIREKAEHLLCEMFRHTGYAVRPLADGKKAVGEEYIPHMNAKYTGYFVSRASKLKLGKKTLTATYQNTKRLAFYKVFCEAVAASLIKTKDMTTTEEKTFDF